jgi:ThiF family
VNHLFSNKAADGYSNYFDKISTYVNIIQSPAQALDPAATALMYRVRSSEEHPIFRYDNTNASRAKITGLDIKFAGQRVAIIGLGGTGVYVLDALAKCPIPEIHLFDRDLYYMHNAYRSPGATSLDTLDRAQRKVDYYAELYGKMHKGIFAHPDYITPDNLERLLEMSQVFICIDKPEVKQFLLPFLMKNQIPFIDVGMGLHLVNNTIIGTLRVTTGRPGMYDHLSKRISIVEDEDNEYNANIQIAELNGLNAFFAVVQWKKMLGVYGDQLHEHNLSYNIDTSQLADDDHSA